jgi:uncharacterized protein YuzE
MARLRKSINVRPSRLLTLAAQRVELPALPLRIEYDADVDTPYLRFKEGVSPTHSEDDVENGLVYDYRGKELVGIEILDASQE